MTGDTPHAPEPAPDGEPLSYISPRVRRPVRDWSASEIFCWGAILFLTISLAGLIAFRQENPPAAPGARVLSAGTPSNIELPFLSKYVLAVYELEKNSPATNPTLKTQLAQSLFENVESAQDLIRAEIVNSEITGSASQMIGDTLPPRIKPDPEMQKDWQTLHEIYASQPPGDSNVPPPSEAQIARLKKRYGWFADLALSSGKPATDPLRQKVLADAYFTLSVAGLGVFGLFLAGIAGCVLLIIAIVRLTTGKMRLAFPLGSGENGMAADRRRLLQGFCLYLSGYVLLALFARYVLGLSGLWPDAIALPLGFAMGFTWPILTGQPAGDWKLALGLFRGRGIFREMASGVAGYLVGLPVIALAAIVTLILVRFTRITPTHPIERTLFGGPWSIALAFFLVSIWAPVTEELMFRGALFSSLRERYGWWISAPVMALVFAAIHPQGWIALPVLGAIALALAGIREWRGSIVGCMTAHCLHNTATLLAVLFMMRS